MAIYAIGDLHLASVVDKPMDVFGDRWQNHANQMRDAWLQLVNDEDTVLIPGDISWAMTLDEAQPDLQWIGALPGHKVMIRGNHDYWWSGIQKVRAQLTGRTYALQNDSLISNQVVIAGTRGWVMPRHPNFTVDDEKILERERHRLILSLDSAKSSGLPIICMMHYPPIDEIQDAYFHDILVSYGVRVCLYGHLHGASHRFAVNEKIDGVQYQLVSSDYLQFQPLLIPDTWWS